MKTHWLITVSVGAALCVAPTLLAQPRNQPQFKGMGKANGMPVNYVPLVRAMADTGEVFGQAYGPAYAWSASTGYTLLKGLIPEDYAIVQSCTTDGSTLFGIAATGLGLDDPEVPVVWTSRLQPPKVIPGFPPNWTCSDAHCNADGSVVAGYAYEKKVGGGEGIYIWRAGVRKNQGWEFITQWPPGVIYAGINDLNDNGTIGVGGGPDATLEGFSGIRWTKQGGLQVIPDILGGEKDGSFGLCDATGFRASGWASPPEGKWIASVWDPVNSWTLVGKLKPTDSGAGLGVDDTGFAGAGTSEFGTIQQGRTAIYWTARDGIRAVKDVLITDYGLTEADAWKLGDVDAISPNGRFMAGRGLNPQGKFETWWAEVRPFCYADCDNASSPKGVGAGPPVLDIDDYICYQTKFILGDYLYADCQLDGVLDINDFICFQTKFNLGC